MPRWQPLLHVSLLIFPLPHTCHPHSKTSIFITWLLRPFLPLPLLSFFILPVMASQNLKHRPRDEPTTPSTTTTAATTTKNRKAQKVAIAKRGLRSLAIAIAIPFILTTLSAYASGTAAATTVVSKAFWHPPVSVFHLASILTSCFMGLSAWLVWAEGGFHSQPTTLSLFLTQFLLTLAWSPLVFRLGATRMGLMVCIILFAALFACSRSFHRVNPIAGDLVKPCLAWVSFLAVFNYTLV